MYTQKICLYVWTNEWMIYMRVISGGCAAAGSLSGSFRLYIYSDGRNLDGWEKIKKIKVRDRQPPNKKRSRIPGVCIYFACFAQCASLVTMAKSLSFSHYCLTPFNTHETNRISTLTSYSSLAPRSRWFLIDVFIPPCEGSKHVSCTQ